MLPISAQANCYFFYEFLFQSHPIKNNIQINPMMIIHLLWQAEVLEDDC